jgi:hypothetical protein
MITGMGIPNSQSSTPLPMVCLRHRFQRKGQQDNVRKNAVAVELFRRDFSHCYCNRYLTAPSRHERDGRAIGSGGANNGLGQRIGLGNLALVA